RHANCGRRQLRRRQKPRRNRPRLREVADSRTGRRRGGQGYRLDCRRQRPENEGQGLSATVRPAEFLLLCNDGVQHPASSRRTAWKAGLPRPGQLALGRLEVLRCTSAGYLNNGYALLVVTSLLFGAYHWWTGIGNIVEAVLIGVLLMLFYRRSAALWPVVHYLTDIVDF